MSQNRYQFQMNNDDKQRKKKLSKTAQIKKNVYYGFFRKYLDFDARPVTKPTGVEAGL